MKYGRFIKGAVVVWSAGLMTVIILVKTGGFDEALYPVTESILASPNGSPLLAALGDTPRSDTARTDTSWLTSTDAPIPATAFPNWREFLEREELVMMSSSKSMTISPRKHHAPDSMSVKQRMRKAYIDSLNSVALRNSRDTVKTHDSPYRNR